MNRMHNRTLRRYIIAFVLLLVAGYISVVIKDTIDSKNPEVSLPIINVTTGYSTIPNVPRAGYEWNFRTKSVMSPYVSILDIPLIAYDAMPDTPILIGFTMPHKEISIYEGKGMMVNGRVVSSEIFKAKSYSLRTPEEEGIYIYKVVARFDQGTIVHYFALEVEMPHTTI